MIKKRILHDSFMAFRVSFAGSALLPVALEKLLDGRGYRSEPDLAISCSFQASAKSLLFLKTVSLQLKSLFN